ncbi:unnamed protein product [Nyctereutes procyonoides]|uniref:(raccoon dog) hypothetical protein n=1 Tax=Nyctereutes procyonoides TaxID=34880 RepID=A0A811XW44_NYCPR|nr:unnamed protein product [Nyctereutes procyonoides]
MVHLRLLRPPRPVAAPGRQPAPGRPRRCQATGRPRPRTALPIGGFRTGEGAGPGGRPQAPIGRRRCRSRGRRRGRGAGRGLGAARGPGDSRAGGGAAWAGGAGGAARGRGRGRGRGGGRAGGRGGGALRRVAVWADPGRRGSRARGRPGERPARGLGSRPDPDFREVTAHTAPHTAAQAQAPRKTRPRQVALHGAGLGQVPKAGAPLCWRWAAGPSSSSLSLCSGPPRCLHTSILPALRPMSVDLSGVKGRGGAGWVQSKAAAFPKGSDVVGTRMTGGGWQENQRGRSPRCGRGMSLEGSELSAPISVTTVEGREGPRQRSIHSPECSSTL